MLAIFHIALHFLVPAIVVIIFFRSRWQFTYTLLLVSMFVDLDHLLANPIYDPGRCSIGFHPLHTLPPIFLYMILCIIPKTRLIGIGLVIHMLLDSIDCQFNNGVWYV